MMTTTRRLLLSGCATLGLLLGVTAVPGVALADHAGPSTRTAPRAAAGKAGPPTVLQDQAQLSGYDVAVDDDGTTYIGWISSSSSNSDRVVHLCRFVGAQRGCSGGVQSTPSLGISSAAGLKVLNVGGTITFVWFHDTDQSVSQEFGAEIATATVQSDGTLSAPQDRASAPSFGSLMDAEVGPGGNIWTVTALSSGSGNDLQVRPSFGALMETISPPWLVNKARLAFDSGKAVLVLDKFGSVSAPLRVTYRKAPPTWSSLAKVPKTWTVGGAYDLTTARGKPRLVAPVDNANYYPRVATWKGTEFGRLSYTGDKNSCAPTSHDLFTDASGRLADTSFECDKVTVVNQPKDGKAAIARFSTTNTPAGGDPQIGTRPSGTGWVVWGQLSNVSGTTLLAAPVRLPALPTKAVHKTRAGKVTVVGPVSCMPAVDLPVKVKAKPARGWSVASKSLQLNDDGDPGRTLKGASLIPGASYGLKGTAVFKKGGQRKTVEAVVVFKSCPAP